MEMNIEEFLKYEKLFEWYFSYRNKILGSLILLSLALCCISMFFMYLKKEKINYVDIFSKIIFDISVIVGVGIILKSAGLKIKFDDKYMPILIFSFACIMLFAVQIFEGIKFYRNWQDIIKKTGKILINILLSETLLLILMGRLEVIEMVSIGTFIFSIEILNVCLDYMRSKKFEITSLNNWKSDIPIENMDDLFPTRKIQLNNFCKELKNIGSEPFAIMLSAEWGGGKTSFINILKSTMADAEFIEIEGGFEYDVESMLNDIEIQLQHIFKKNNIYTERNGIIESYFENIRDMVGNAGYDWVADIINKLKGNQTESYLECKKNINEILEMFYWKTKRKIFIIVDNLDRIFNDDVRERIFQMITESVRLKNCVTLFVADYNKFSDRRMDQEFLEKYINHQLILCDISFEEILSKFKDNFLSDEFCKNKSEYIRVNSQKLRAVFEKRVNDKVREITERIQICKQTSNGRNLLDEEREKRKKNLQLLENTIERLKVRMINPRKVKRFLDNIETMLYIADAVWFQNEGFEENELSNCDWVSKIFQVAFLKIFLTEEYEALLFARDLILFEKNYERYYIVNYIIEGISDISENALEEKHTSLVVYKLYALNHNIDKTQRQKLAEEIDNDKMTEEQLQNYLNECIIIDFNPIRLQKVYSYIANHEFRNTRIKVAVVLDIMEIISKGFLNHKRYYQIQENVENLISKMMEKHEFSNEDMIRIENYKRVLQTRVIYQNNSRIIELMQLLHDVDLKQNFVENIDSIEKLYFLIIKIHENYPLEGFEKEEDKLTTIKKYFERGIITLNSNKYEYIASEVNAMMIQHIEGMITILTIWFDKKESMPVTDENEKEFCMESVDMLHRWLIDLKTYVQTTTDNVGEAFINVVVETEKKMNDDIGWFTGKEGEIVSLLKSMFDYLSQMNPDFLQEYGDRWNFIKIRIFKMERILEKL